MIINQIHTPFPHNPSLIQYHKPQPQTTTHCSPGAEQHTHLHFLTHCVHHRARLKPVELARGAHRICPHVAEPKPIAHLEPSG